MTYSEFAIKMLREHLTTLAMQDRTPKKYSGPMFEAAEVISQLKRELADAEVEKQALRNAANGYKAVAEGLRAQEAENNAVLTLDELWQMNGEPVWVDSRYGIKEAVQNDP